MEEKYKKELADSGVDIPEIEKPEDKPAKAPIEEKEEPQKEKEESKPEEKETPKDDSEQPTRKRSIYEEYKEKKSENKDLKQENEALRKEKEELSKKLQDLGKAETPEERQEAKDELDEFAIANNLDPKAIKEMQKLFLKDIKSNDVDRETQKKIDEVLAYSKENSKAIEEHNFNKEFVSEGVVALKEHFPNISNDEIQNVREKLNQLAHTKGFEDKSLDYIVFKHKKELSNFVSPKKRGIEGSARIEDSEEPTDFNTNPDFSKMNLKQIKAWEDTYKEAQSASSLATDSQGRKIFI